MLLNKTKRVWTVLRLEIILGMRYLNIVEFHINVYHRGHTFSCFSLKSKLLLNNLRMAFGELVLSLSQEFENNNFFSTRKGKEKNYDKNRIC